MQQLDSKVLNAVTNAVDGVPKETSYSCNEEDEELEKMVARRRKGKIVTNQRYKF